MKILIHLISGQNVPNYIAAKISNPDLNILIYSKDSEAQMKYLKNVLGASKCKTEIINPWDFNECFNKAIKFINEYKTENLILNFTGGTKISSLAFFSAFREMKKQALYINTEKDTYKIFNFNNEHIEERDFIIEIIGNLKDYFGLTGQVVRIGEKFDLNKYLDLRNFIQNNYSKVFNLILKTIKANQNNKSFFEIYPEGNFRGSIITYKNNKSALKVVYQNKTFFDILETGKTVINYFIGGWFEHLCFEKLKSINYFDDIQLNVNIEYLHTKEEILDKNEIDILAIKGVYPVIFECKSGGFKSENIDKLISIKDYVGRYTDTYFVTFMNLDRNNATHRLLLEKMREKNIIHLTFDKLSNFSIKQKPKLK